ncbi:MAG: hypothetical protein BMS9Abin37_0693 [Acidobacteriota bacterium]|nr:MAG: hypothetical protein BMS9Abin37_0693 [Acidobacteriota bacterium]
MKVIAGFVDEGDGDSIACIGGRHFCICSRAGEVVGAGCVKGAEIVIGIAVGDIVLENRIRQIRPITDIRVIDRVVVNCIVRAYSQAYSEIIGFAGSIDKVIDYVVPDFHNVTGMEGYGVHIRDFQATLLHLFGIDHERFTVNLQGLDAKLTGVEPARVVTEILA